MLIKNSMKSLPIWVSGFFATAIFGSGISYNSIYLFHVFYVIALIWLVCALLGGRTLSKFPRIKKHNIFYLVMVIIYALSILWSKAPDYAAKYFIYVFIGISIIFITESYVVNKDRYGLVFKVIALCFFVEMLISFFESLGVFRWPFSRYSADTWVTGGPQIDWVSDPSLEESLVKTPTGFRGNPNNLALMMVVAFPFLILSRSFFFRYGLSAVLIYLTYCTGSRGAIISIILELAIILWVEKNLIKFSLMMIVPALISSQIDNELFINFYGFINESYNALSRYFMFTESRGYLESISIRHELINAAWSEFIKTYGLGLGGGGSGMTQIDVRSGEVIHTSLHNFWLEIIFDAGVVIFTGFFSLFTLLAIRLITKGRRLLDPFYHYHCVALGIAFLGFMVGCVSASSVIYHLPMWVMLGLGFSLFNIINERVKGR